MSVPNVNSVQASLFCADFQWIGYKNRAGRKMDEWCYQGVRRQGTHKKLQFDDFHTGPNQKIDLNAPSSKNSRSLGNPLSGKPVSLNGPKNLLTNKGVDKNFQFKLNSKKTYLKTEQYQVTYAKLSSGSMCLSTYQYLVTEMFPDPARIHSE